MSYADKHSTKVWGSALIMVIVGAIAIWQFYLFATFKDASGVADLQGGTNHFWWAVAMTILACASGFFVFSSFVRHDRDDELHITS